MFVIDRFNDSVFRLTSIWMTKTTKRFPFPSEALYQKTEIPIFQFRRRFFWKVIVDGESNRGIAMLGSNNPHAAQAPPCSNITQEVTWLRSAKRQRQMFF